MRTYREWRGTNFASFNGDPWADWLVVIHQTRDSDALERSNYRVARKAMVGANPEDWTESLSSHWAHGTLDVLLVKPGTLAADIARGLQGSLDNYPVLDEADLSEVEQEEADETWRGCYSPSERLDYIRRYRDQFEFHDLADMLGCVRGKYFAGYASELIS